MLRDSADKDGAPKEVLKTNEASLNTMAAYCENPCDCRRVLLLSHFGETSFDRSQCKSSCDNCAALSTQAYELRDVTAVAHAAAELVALNDGMRDPGLVDALKGSSTKQVPVGQVTSSQFFGFASSYKKSEVERIVRHMTVMVSYALLLENR